MNIELLKLLYKNAKYTHSQLADMLDISEEEVKSEIETLEKEGYIRGYKAVIDWEKVENPMVSALVELNVSPQAGLGFEEVAEKVMTYHEVESIFLVSGSYDLSVIVKGKTLQDVSKFVARELATIDAVTGTSTHFVMRRYKELDVELCSENEDSRGQFLYD